MPVPSRFVSLGNLEVGDVLVRDNGPNREITENALVIHVARAKARPDTFRKAVLLASYGTVPINPDARRFGHTDFRPADWVWSPEGGTYHPPTVKWIAKAEGFVEKGKNAKAVDAEVTEDDDDVPARDRFAGSLPDVAELTTGDNAPHIREPFMTWKARMRKTFPALRSTAGGRRVSDGWKQYRQNLKGTALDANM